jgi:hypothetical protein
MGIHLANQRKRRYQSDVSSKRQAPVLSYRISVHCGLLVWQKARLIAGTEL